MNEFQCKLADFIKEMETKMADDAKYLSRQEKHDPKMSIREWEDQRTFNRGRFAMLQRFKQFLAENDK